jgi:hypothetical protein
MRAVNTLHTMPPEISPSTRGAMSDFFQAGRPAHKSELLS